MDKKNNKCGWYNIDLDTFQRCIVYYDRRTKKYQYYAVFKGFGRYEFNISAKDYYYLREQYCDVNYSHYTKNTCYEYREIFPRVN